MSVVDLIRARVESVERVRIEVPEWGDKDGPLVIFAKPVTGADVNKLQLRHKNFLSEMQMMGMVDLIVRKAEDESGSKMFADGERFVLAKEQFAVLSRIAGEIFGDGGADAAKN